jgi:hypothetical protein
VSGDWCCRSAENLDVLERGDGSAGSFSGPLPFSITIEIHPAALKIADKHDYNVYDALIVAAALEAGSILKIFAMVRRWKGRSRFETPSLHTAADCFNNFWVDARHLGVQTPTSSWIIYLRDIRTFKGEPGQIFQLETRPSRKYTVDDPYFQEDSLNSVGVPCAASTSSVVEPTVKYPRRYGPGPEGSISALRGEPGEISQPATLPPWKYTVDDP